MRRPLVTTVRWLARAGSLAALSLLILFGAGEGFDPGALRGIEWVLMALFPFGVALGLLISWRRERLGAWISLLCLAGFYLVHITHSGRAPSGIAFVMLTSPAVAFLAAAELDRHAGTEAAASGRQA